MLLNLILWSAIIIALIAMYIENNTAIKAKNRVLLGVTIPYEHIKDTEVLDIVEEYKKGNKLYLLIGIIAFIPSHLVSYISIKMIYLFLWIALMQILSYKLFFKYSNKLKKIKIDNHWHIESKRLITIDTEVTRLKDKMPVSQLWFIPSFIISLIPILIVLLNNDISFGVIVSSTTGLLGNIILFITYKIYCKKPTDIHSEDTNINIAYNLIFKRTWTIGIIIAATIQSTSMILIFLPMTLNYNSLPLLILSMAVPPVVIVGGIYYINSVVSDEQNRLLESSNKAIYVDDDEYWYRDIYNNPNDSRYIVEPRIGYKMTYNLGTKKGKRVYYGSFIFAGILILGISIMMLRLDFGRFDLLINKDIVEIKAPQYSINIDRDDIQEIKMIDKINVKIRTNGAATDQYAIGHFEVEDYGNCRLYIYDKDGPYIMLKLKNNKYVFISGTSDEETKEYYNELTK